jgi:hypothetical protein
MYGVDYKLIAYASYTTVGGAIQAGFTARNCSLFYNNAGSVNIRVGTPGPLTAANTPANLATEFSRAIGNLVPVVTVGTAARAASITQVNDTTYQILATDLAVPGAAESAIWFGLFTLMA